MVLIPSHATDATKDPSRGPTHQIQWLAHEPATREGPKLRVGLMLQPAANSAMHEKKQEAARSDQPVWHRVEGSASTVQGLAPAAGDGNEEDVADKDGKTNWKWGEVLLAGASHIWLRIHVLGGDRLRVDRALEHRVHE